MGPWGGGQAQGVTGAPEQGRGCRGRTLTWAKATKHTERGLSGPVGVQDFTGIGAQETEQRGKEAINCKENRRSGGKEKISLPRGSALNRHHDVNSLATQSRGGKERGPGRVLRLSGEGEQNGKICCLQMETHSRDLFVGLEVPRGGGCGERLSPPVLPSTLSGLSPPLLRTPPLLYLADDSQSVPATLQRLPHSALWTHREPGVEIKSTFN